MKDCQRYRRNYLQNDTISATLWQEGGKKQMRKLVIWYLKRKLEDIRHEIESVEINQDVIHKAEEVHNTLRKKEKAFADTITMLENKEY